MLSYQLHIWLVSYLVLVNNVPYTSVYKFFLITGFIYSILPRNLSHNWIDHKTTLRYFAHEEAQCENYQRGANEALMMEEYSFRR